MLHVTKSLKIHTKSSFIWLPKFEFCLKNKYLRIGSYIWKICLFACLSIWKSIREGERERQKRANTLVRLSNACNIQARPSPSQEPGTPYSATWVTGTQTLGPALVSFPGTLARSWICSTTARAWPSTLTWDTRVAARQGWPHDAWCLYMHLTFCFPYL